MARQSGSLISRRPLPLPHLRGRSRNPFVWLWRIWRYGWHHPDEDLLGVIDVAGDSLRAQIASARAVLTGAAAAEAEKIALEIERELDDQNIPDLARLLGFETRINALYPPALQRRRAWMLRERFERVAPERAALDYWASNPPDPAAAGMAEEELKRSEAAVRQALAERDRTRTEAAEADSAAGTSDAEAKAQRAALAGKDDAEVEALLAELEPMRDSVPPQDTERSRELEDLIGALLTARKAEAAARERLGNARAEEQKAAAALRAAEAVREVARARVELLRVQRDLAAAAATAREAVTSGNSDQAEAALARLRAEHQTVLTRLDSAETALEALGAEGVEAGTDPRPGGHIGAVDADAQTLLGYIHSAYLMSVGREKAVRDLLRWLMMRFWSANIVAALLLLGVYALFSFGDLLDKRYLSFGNLVVGLFLIAAIGRIGATMSVVQRLQNAIGGNILTRDAMQEITRLRTGKNGINVALFSGAVFALLLYAMFASGVAAAVGFDDGIFPGMVETRGPVVAVTETPSPDTGDKEDEGSNTAGTATDVGNDLEASENGAAAQMNNAAAPADGNMVAPEAGDGAAANMAAGETPADAGKPAAGGAQNDASGGNRPVQCKAGQSCDPFRQLAEALGFADRSDFFKLLIWAFLAGFAERLVPDVLDNITRRTRAGTQADADAALQRRIQSAQTSGGSGAATGTTMTATTTTTTAGG